jgi:plastocyanin
MRTILSIIIILVVVFGGYYYFAKSNTASTTATYNTDTSTTTEEYGTTSSDTMNMGSSTTASTSASSASSTTAKTATVTIQNFAFAPANLTVKVGTKVTWTNHDSAPHTVTSDTGTTLNSAQLSNGESYSHTFTQPGTYNYHCTVHPNMKATITVTS